MATPLEKMLQDAFGDLDNLSPEKIEGLVQEAVKIFTALKEKTHSTDPKQREEALKTALSLKKAMEAQTEELSKLAGIDPASFSSLAENQELFTPETWAELTSAQQELEA